MNRLQKSQPRHTTERNEIEGQNHQISDSASKIERIDQSLRMGTAIFAHASEGIMVTDPHGVILNVNPGFCAITGYDPADVEGKNASLLKSDRHESEFFASMWRTLGQAGLWQGEIWNRRKNGEIYPEWLTISTIKDDGDKVRSFVGIFTDITQYINKNVQIRNQAYYDSLTGLPNRLLMHDRLSFMLSHAKRNGQLMSLLLLDLNRFKFINDTLGYATGDLLLKTVANRLKSCLREVDGVFRLGDDEFAIILEEIAQQQDAAKVAKRILDVCSLPFLLADHEVYVSSSIGISIFPMDGDDLESMLKNAEAAMHRAKEMGINNYQHYKPAMNARAFEQLTLEHNLRKAIKQDEFIVYYQPQVDLANGVITGAEALVRWQHPELGMISPGQFIPIAEETGLILPIGKLVLETACRQAKDWEQRLSKPLRMSVNLSPRQFQQQDLVTMIDAALKDTGLRPGLLEIEITESLGMKNPEATMKTLHELKAMGMHIAIDDFGTGYSSLSYLKRFPIDTIKIDRSFVSDIPENSNDSAIVLAIIALAHSLKLTVIAEGVENKEQESFLASHGCEKEQGYLFSPPVSPKDFEELLLRNTSR